MNINKMKKAEVIERIINQANALNKKIKKFSNEGITEHEQYVHTLLGDQGVKYNKSGSVSKSKKFYGELNVLQLKRTLSALHKLNNHEIYGTVKKYNKVMSRQYIDIMNFTKEHLESKGYSEDFVNTVISQKGFFDTVTSTFNSGLRGYGSEQVIEKVALQYNNGLINKREMEKTINNIEHSRNTSQRIQNESEMFKKWLEERNKNRR